ncbi:MAG TPA: PP2C family protein-serine/threonine phosphatase [Humisphaera sp.]
MTCMEVWGGNRVVDSSVVLAGLDAWVYSRPFGDSSEGGDVYYVSSCATGRITRLLVADVSGHGASVGEVATGLRQLMRRFVNHIDQARFVRAMNGEFAEMSRNGGFATAVVTTFFAPTNRLSLCNAGHPVPLHYVAAEGRWRLLESGGRTESADSADAPANLPLGILDLSDYDQFDVTLALGDLVLCYTDSLIESCGTDACTMLGQRGLLDVVNGMDIGDPATFIARLQAKLAEICPANLTNDDVTVLLFRANGGAPNTPVKERVLAPFRVAREVLRSFLRRDHAAPLPELSVANIGGNVVPSLGKVGTKAGK